MLTFVMLKKKGKAKWLIILSVYALSAPKSFIFAFHEKFYVIINELRNILNRSHGVVRFIRFLSLFLNLLAL